MSHDRVGRLDGDAAEPLRHAVDVLRHLDVPAVAPLLAPRVLDDPILVPGTGLQAAPDDGDAVVQLRPARPVVHALLVVLEVVAAGLDGHGHGLPRHRVRQRRLAAGRHATEPVDGDGVVGELGAVAGPRVRVVGLRGDAAVGGDPPHRAVRDAAAAAGVQRVAVHQLLLRQRDQLPRPDLVDAFHHRHRRERPARPC
jgi:hypothetical protein